MWQACADGWGTDVASAWDLTRRCTRESLGQTLGLRAVTGQRQGPRSRAILHTGSLVFIYTYNFSE